MNFVKTHIIQKTVDALREAGSPFVGTVLFCKIQNVIVCDMFSHIAAVIKYFLVKL